VKEKVVTPTIIIILFENSKKDTEKNCANHRLFFALCFFLGVAVEAVDT
jgi:hypothetical protein